MDKKVYHACDGKLKDGSCNHPHWDEQRGNACLGEKCPNWFGNYDYVNERGRNVGGGYTQPSHNPVSVSEVIPAKDDRPCRHADKDGFCYNPNCNGGGFKCIHCEDYNPVESLPAPVVEIPKTFTIVTHGREVSVETAKALNYQFMRCNKAMGSATMEMCRFGAMLEMIDDSLTKQRFTRADRGDGKGQSLKAWMEEHCPEIPYATAKSYQYAAKGIRNMLQLAADRPLLPLMGVQPLAEEEQESLRKKIIETVTGSSLNILRRASMPQTPGNALKGTHGVAQGRRALTAEEKAAEAEKTMRQLVGDIGAYLRGPWFDMLSDSSQDDFVGALKHYVDVMNEKIAER